MKDMKDRYTLYVRTSASTPWISAAYGGCYATVEAAVEKAKKEMGRTPFEYRVEDSCTDKVVMGLVGYGGSPMMPLTADP